MNNSYTAVIKDEGNCWIGWIQEVPGVNCQENTYEELIDTLKVTLSEAIEFNKNDAISAAGSHFREEKILV
jgi:predicted RNase H-like HicB family nuclease